MRVMLVSIVILACLIGASFAQDAPPPTFVYRWERQASAHDFARRYPRPAINGNISGAAVMCCIVNETRRLDCNVPFEWPEGSGFAEATLAISREFQLTEESYAEVVGTERARVRRMIRWIAGGSSPELDAAYARIGANTQAICDAAEGVSS
jgi:hypothetical protein